MSQTTNLTDRMNVSLALVGASVRWRYSDVAAWVESGCPEESKGGTA